MESEGPYFIDKDGYITGPTGKHDFVTLDTLKVFNSVFECGKSEGRKSMEKELEELYKIASELCIERNNLYGFETDGILDFAAYKKLRGIE